MRSHVLGACLAALLPLTAQGATFTESALGDFSNAFNSPTFLGILSLGLNTVSGSISAECTATFTAVPNVLCDNWAGDRRDYFSFNIGDGQALTAATLTISMVNANNVTERLAVGGVISLDDPVFWSSGCLFDTNFVGSGGLVTNDGCGPLTILKDGVVAATGLQSFGVGIISNCCGVHLPFEPKVSFDWTVALRVVDASDLPPAVIPLPATLPLLLGSIAGLGLVVRRRKAVA